MNAWHFHARYYNFGDYALAVGLRNVFSRWFSEALIYKTFDTHSVVFTRPLVGSLNETADLLLVGGGGLIHEFGGQWLFHMPTGLIPDLCVPMIFYGLGYNAFRGDGGLSPAVIENIMALRAKALSFSVRNDGSRERLARFGIDAPEVADPGFFVDGDYARPLEEPYIVVQLAGDCVRSRGYAVEALVDGIACYASHALRSGLRVILAPHVRHDIALGEAVAERLGRPPGLGSWNFFEMLREEHTPRGLAFYKHARHVVAMRGHSQICPIGMGTPVITVANHDKHVGLIANLGVRSYYVEASDPNLGSKLVELEGEIERSRDSIAAEYRSAISRMIEHTAEFLSKLKRGYDRALPLQRAGPPQSMRSRLRSALAGAATRVGWR
jgi:polysaccharide pyruvyl transferase WcaK-like protein